MEFSGRGFGSHSGQLFIVASKSPSFCEYHRYQVFPLQRDYLCQTSLKANVATDLGKD